MPPPRTTRADPLIGSVVNGKYRVLALVAAGGMGRIYRAEQIPLGRAVALKVLHSQTGPNHDDPHFKKRFFREASLLAKLQHPNIVTLFDYGGIEGGDEQYFMAMEFLSGETLSRRISERGNLPMRDVVRIARNIARGLAEAHAEGIVHRDLKPSNVMLVPGRDGEELVKIVDFGIVKVMGEEPSNEELTQEGSFIGSPKYMAPEQITRGATVDARTDVYALGIILYQCLTGTVPFDAASSIQTMMAHLNQMPMPMRERAPHVPIPDWLDALVMECLEKEPEKRPQTMELVARALGEAEAALTSHGSLSTLGQAVVSQMSSSPGNSSPSFTSSTGARRLSMGAASSQAPGTFGRTTSGVTEQGTISSLHPQGPNDATRTSPGQKPAMRTRAAVAIGIFGALLVIGVAFFFLRPRPLPATTAAPPPVPTAPAPKKTFSLQIDSVPTGAEVHEGDELLGVTPLHLTIDNDAVRLEPRKLTVSKDGFSAYSVVQGPSEDAVRIVAPLAIAPAPSSTASGSNGSAAKPSAPRRGGGPSKPASAQGQSSSTQPRPDLDIRLTR